MTLSASSGTLRTARFRAAVLLLALCAGVGGACLVTAFIPPTYQAQASIVVTSRAQHSSAQNQNPGPDIAQSLVPTVLRLAESDTVARAVAASTRLPDDLVFGHIHADAQPTVQIVTLTASANTGARAALIANAAARALSEHLEHQPLSGDASLDAQQLDRAAPPAQPTDPKPLLDGALGGLLGLLTGLVLLAVRDGRDDRLHSLAQIEAELGMLILAVSPRLSPRLLRRGVRPAYQRPEIRDSTRTAVATLAALTAVGPQAPCRRLLVTSVHHDDGKAVLAALLALGLVEQHERVTLVDGQLHQPVLGRYLQDVRQFTLQDILGADITPFSPSGDTPDRLCVITADPTDQRQSAALLRGEAFGRLMDRIAERSDVVLVHAPPVLSSPDFAVLARHAESVILVVQAGATRGRDARRVLQLLRCLGARIAGVAVTSAVESGQLTRWYPAAAAGADGRDGALTAPAAAALRPGSAGPGPLDTAVPEPAAADIFRAPTPPGDDSA